MLAQLDRTLPPPDAQGRCARSARSTSTRRSRWERVATTPRGGGATLGDGELRTLSFAGLPSDLRVKLCGRWLYDADGLPDIRLYIHEAKVAGLPPSKTRHCHVHAKDRASRDAWHEHAAQWHAERLGAAVEPAAVKRWPNILGNGGGYARCLDAAELPTDAEKCPKVLALQEELRQLRADLLAAPCHREYVQAQRAHLARSCPISPSTSATTSLCIPHRDDRGQGAAPLRRHLPPTGARGRRRARL